MKRFSEWTYADVIERTAEEIKRRVGADQLKVNREIVDEQNLWRDGEMWVGPRGSDAVWNATQKASVERQHIPGGACTEALGNFVNGLASKEANVQLVPRTPPAPGSGEEAALKEEAQQLLADISAWWDSKGLWWLLRPVLARSRYATWGTFRRWIAEGNLVSEAAAEGSPPTTRLPKVGTFTEAMALVELSAPEPDHALLVTDPSTRRKAAVFHFTTKTDAGAELKSVELWYGEGEQSMLRILTERGEPRGPFPQPWGGRLPISEMEGELLITEIVRRKEMRLGFSETNLLKIGEAAGYRERYTGNAEPSGVWLATPPVNGEKPLDVHTEDGKTWYLHATPRNVGPSYNTDLIGLIVKKSDEGEERGSPSITIADPVDPDYGIKPVGFSRLRVLEACHQGHLAMVGTGESSGHAYQQGRAGFECDLQTHKGPAEGLIASTIEGAIAMGDSMLRVPLRILERFRVVVTLTVFAGPIHPETINGNLAQVTAGTLSRASAMARNGVEDVAAELEAIRQDPEAQAAFRGKLLTNYQVMRAAEPDMDPVELAMVAGFDDAEANRLFQGLRASRAQKTAEDEEIRRALQGDPAPEPRKDAA